MSEDNKIEALILAAEDMLRFGAHDGACDNEGDGACSLHMAAFTARADALRAAVADPRNDILLSLLAERARQDAKWGEQNHPDGTGQEGDAWRAFEAKERCDVAVRYGELTYRLILNEEVQEAFAESDPEKLETELIQVAAVAVAWVEKLRRGRNGGMGVRGG